MSTDLPVVRDADHFLRVKNASKLILKNFFKDKKYFFGGKIPDKRLLSRDSFDFVTDTELEQAIEYAYQIAIPQIKNKKKDVVIAWDIDKILYLISHMAEYDIPHSAKPGIILLYFKFCHGCKISRKHYLKWLEENPVK